LIDLEIVIYLVSNILPYSKEFVVVVQSSEKGIITGMLWEDNTHLLLHCLIIGQDCPLDDRQLVISVGQDTPKTQT
jgi:hypothetical protein